ncbi:uncharacterized protein LOC100893885 [Strongylocentrotus purpuratus]|uniref:Uncharacterized protein n=1 Tax=Strongylocentrotus purpuratus TaxID=7668 RepID=A0A7M7NXJ9_STRPU|nr:uncharacterized protein LOC100893885 [Strongylocentrotus purpuratus]
METRMPLNLTLVLFLISIFTTKSTTLAEQGCADGSTEGLLSKDRLAACSGKWEGHVGNASHLCAPGWGVCSWEQASLLGTLTWTESVAIEGCFAYNAAHDRGECGPCKNTLEQDDLGGIGKHCPHQNKGQSSCIASGRIDASCCLDSHFDRACHYRPGLMTGVVCCKLPEIPPAIHKRFPAELPVSLGHNITLHCPASGNPPPRIKWLKNGDFLFQDTYGRIIITQDTLVIHKTLLSDSAEYSCIASNTVGYAKEDVRVKVSEKAIKKDIGCKDGTIEGLHHMRSIAACSGAWKGHVRKGKALCAHGWRVCNHEDVDTLKHISWLDATSMNGCYAYNAANNDGVCTSCTGEPGHDVLGGIGRHCSKRRQRHDSCLGEGRIDIFPSHREFMYEMLDKCSFQEGLLSGVLCCRIPDRPDRKKGGAVGGKQTNALCDSECRNGGRCIGANRCWCPEGYKGALCQIPVCDPECPAGSDCAKPGVCECLPGKEGRKCRREGKSRGREEVSRKPSFGCKRLCRNGGLCHLGRCFCPAYTRGKYCQRTLKLPPGTTYTDHWEPILRMMNGV